MFSIRFLCELFWVVLSCIDDVVAIQSNFCQTIALGWVKSQQVACVGSLITYLNIKSYQALTYKKELCCMVVMVPVPTWWRQLLAIQSYHCMSNEQTSSTCQLKREYNLHENMPWCKSKVHTRLTDTRQSPQHEKTIWEWTTIMMKTTRMIIVFAIVIFDDSWRSEWFRLMMMRTIWM